MVDKEQISLVIVGHVDHGKSTLVGKLLADSASLPLGKLEQIKEKCKRESKVFEYAYLLDALKDEQSQGITIDSARTIFKSKKRQYSIIDAPGHMEFLKNMISGASHAEVAVIVIDAKEGIKENSKRHGYILSLLNITNIIVCINKMDLINYDPTIYNQIKDEFSLFLRGLNVTCNVFIPISAYQGDNLFCLSPKLPWYKGESFIESLDNLQKPKSLLQKPLRMPVQDIYKFTKKDDRRIISGRIESGFLHKGDEVIFYPSGKKSTIKSIEEFNSFKDKTTAVVNESIGVCLNDELYVSRGEIMCLVAKYPPLVSTLFNANIFWMGKNDLCEGEEFIIKLGTSKVLGKVKKIISVINSSNLNISKSTKVKSYEVCSCIIECKTEIAFDIYSDIYSTGRFVLVDNNDVSGGGIITGVIKDNLFEIREGVKLRDSHWASSNISSKERSLKFAQKPTLLFITGKTGIDKISLAQNIERELFNEGRNPYFLGIKNLIRGVNSDLEKIDRIKHIKRLGEVTHLLLGAGLFVIATASDVTINDISMLKEIVGKDNLLLVGFNTLYGIEDIILTNSDELKTNTLQIITYLKQNNFIFNNY